MRESTRKDVEAAVARLAEEQKFTLTPAGLVYHSKNLWIGVTTEEDVVVVARQADGTFATRYNACCRDERVDKTPKTKKTPKPKAKKQHAS